VNAFPIDDSIPNEQEICEAVKRMRRGKAPGGSGIRVEHLQKWKAEAKESNDLEKKDVWRRVVPLVEMAFTDQPLPRSFGVGILVLIPKGVPDQYRGIALLEVIYKLVSSIINLRISQKIQYHNAIHEF
jgi:hypothetical protein